MRHRMGRLFAVVILASLPVIAATPAQAAVNCDSIVTDDARVFSDTSGIERAAEEASRRVGADVHVVTTKSYTPAASLDEFYQNTLAKCASWQGRSADGSVVPKSNLLALFMSLDERKVAIMYGDDWKSALDGGTGLRIQSEEMGPFFRGGDFAGGFAKGIESSQQAIYDVQHPAPQAPVTNIDNSEPVDLTGLWFVLGALALCFVGVLVFFGLKAGRQQREERAAAKKKAVAERDATSRLLRELDDEANSALRTSRVARFSKAGDEEARQLSELVGQVKRHKAAAENGMAAAASSFGSDLDSKLSVREYQIIEGYYLDTHNDAAQAKAAADKIDEICKRIEESLSALPGQLDSLRTRVEIHGMAVDELVSKGYRFDRGDVEGLNTLMTRAESKGATLEALQDVNEAGEKMSELESSLSNFQQLIVQQEASREELRARLAKAQAKTSEAAQSFQRISTTYASSSWESITGNGTEATKRLSEAADELKQADEAASMDSQKWEKVQSSTQKGNLLVDEAFSLLDAITDREDNLAKAKASAQQEIDLAQADIDKAAQYMDDFDDDVRDSLEGDLAEARDLLDKARSELSCEQPNYLIVLDSALGANRMADRIFDEAVGEHEAAERLRHQAESAVERASITINKAERFIANHSGDVGRSASRSLNSSKTNLQMASSASNPADKLHLAEKSLEQAQSAYNKAKSEFDDAEAAREAERRRKRREREEREERQRRDATVIVAGSWGSSSSSSSSSSWGSSNSFGGGSSSSFGGFDGGGGGSSSGW